MPDALTIDFAVSNVSRVEKAFTTLAKLTANAETRMNALTKSVNAAASAYAGLNTQITRFNRLSGASGGFGGAAGGKSPSSGGSGAASARTPSYVQGPFQRQEKLGTQLTSALATGNKRAAVDIKLAQSRNEAQIKRILAPEKGLGAKFADVLKTSRFGVGAGGKMEMMPLVGRTAALAAEALGPEIAALAGPVGLVVGAAIAAGTAVFNLAKSAAEAGAAFTSFQISVGSFGLNASSALAIGRQGGLSADQTAGQASALQEGITGSALGRSVGMKYGAFNLGGYYGSQDTAGQYAQVIAALRASKAPMEEKLRDARVLGIQGSLGAIMTSDKQYAYAGKDAAVHSQIFDPEFAQKSADFNSALGRVGDAAENLMAALGKPFLSAMTAFFNSLADNINKFAVFMNSPNGQMLTKALGFVAGGPVSAAANYAGGFNAMGNIGASGTANSQATQDNTKALHGLTAALPGVYGNDTDGRMGRAFPGGAGKGAMAQARAQFVSGAVQLGAF